MTPLLTPGKIYSAPSAFAIGWIPIQSCRDRMPEAFARRKRAWGLKPLFFTGNKPPPDEFAGEAHFQTFVEAKDYRAIIGVAGVEVSFNETGASSENAPLGDLTHGGYTPYRLTMGDGNTSVSFRHFSSGVTREASSIAIGCESAPFGISQDFRISTLGNIMSRLLIGHFAPFARMDIAYEVFADGRYEVSFGGTYVPSQAYYVGWKKVGEHHLEHISNEQLDDFLTAETRRARPLPKARFVHNGRIS